MSTEPDMRYMDSLEEIALEGVQLIREKTATYGDSWKRRGGQGAWFTTVRPWDRLEGIVHRHGGDVIAAVLADPTGADGSALACIRDLRNYLLLIEAHASVLTMDAGNKTIDLIRSPLEVLVDRAREHDPAHEHERRVRVLRDTYGYTVHSCQFMSPREIGWTFVPPGGKIPSTSIRKLWPHATAEEAWQAAWEHVGSTLDEGTRAGAAPAQPVEDAGDPSATPPATTVAAVTSQGPHASQRRTRAPTDEQVAALVEHANLLGLDVQVTPSLLKERTILTLSRNETARPSRSITEISSGVMLNHRVRHVFEDSGFRDVEMIQVASPGSTTQFEFVVKARVNL